MRSIPSVLTLSETMVYKCPPLTLTSPIDRHTTSHPNGNRVSPCEMISYLPIAREIGVILAVILGASER